MTKIKDVRVAECDFLESLGHFPTMPTRLYVKGPLPDRRLPTVAIIGSRRPTSYGREVSYDLAYKLAKKGVVIVSGLAFGIDAVAHQAAVDAGGLTIAVQANGLDHVYPSTHRRLAQQILDSGGALVSEYEEGITPRAHQFLERNRLISGLADVLVVTEASERSGTVSTVNHALEQGKEVYAVPGPITSVLSVGPNRLIEQGAQALISIDDFVNTFVVCYPID